MQLNKIKQTLVKRKWLVAVLAVLVVAGSYRAATGQCISCVFIPQAKASEQKQAPQWKLETLDGMEYGSAQLTGKVQVVNFWATWCPPCRREIPDFIRVQKELGPKGVQFVGISLDSQGPEPVKRFAEKREMNYPIVMGNDAVVEAFGGFSAIPTTFIVDRQGNIVKTFTGAVKEATLMRTLMPLL